MSEELKPISQIVDEELAKVTVLNKHIKTESITITSDFGRRIVSNSTSRYNDQFKKGEFNEQDVIDILDLMLQKVNDKMKTDYGTILISGKDIIKQFKKQKSNG